MQDGLLILVEITGNTAVYGAVHFVLAASKIEFGHGSVGACLVRSCHLKQWSTCMRKLKVSGGRKCLKESSLYFHGECKEPCSSGFKMRH